MSRFFSERYQNLIPYTPGEQPRDQKYVKLNTNESPFPPIQAVAEAVTAEAEKLQLYSDPESTALIQKLAEHFNVSPEQVITVNGSDEILNFAFMAFADKMHPLAFADITYGFYPVFAELNHIPYTILPLRPDFTLAVEDYLNIGKTVVIANPNAPTGLAISRREIERIVAENPDNVVIIDEAYVDFGAESAVPLVQKYSNLLVTQTFSKSRSMAGARLGFGIGDAALIRDLNTIRYSTNPYNVNRMSCMAGVAALENQDYFDGNCRIITENRRYTIDALRRLGFEVLESKANFIFARTPEITGGDYYRQLKAHGVLVRHFEKPRISDFVRITIGTREQMDFLLACTKEILGGKKS